MKPTTTIHLCSLLAIIGGITANAASVNQLKPRQDDNSSEDSTLGSGSESGSSSDSSESVTNVNTGTGTSSVMGIATSTGTGQVSLTSNASSTTSIDTASASATTSAAVAAQDQQQQEPPSNVTAVQPNSQGWYPYGCYTDCADGDQKNRGLPVWVYTDASNGPEKCIEACAAKGYVLAGLQYNEECWCGNSLGGQPTSNDECNYTCQDGQNPCGGDCRQNVWSSYPPGIANSHI
ncbi:hypothetical protein IAU59_007135 [Kwoniella sp. CBS 9459]